MKKISKVQIAQKYAQALYEAANIDKALDVVFNECQVILEVLDKVDELYVLNNPELSSFQKQEIISKVAKSLKLSKTSKNFLSTIIENNRFSELKNIYKQFYKYYYKQQGIIEVLVQSVQPLTDEQHKKMLSGLEKALKKKIIINYKINPDILGGLIVEYGSSRIDDSVKGKLNSLEHAMKGNV